MDINIIALMMPLVMALWKEVFSNSMNESINEEGNGEKEKERSDNENKRRNSHIPSKGRFAWWGAKCNLMDDVGLFVANGRVIACDPMKAIFDN